MKQVPVVVPVESLRESFQSVAVQFRDDLDHYYAARPLSMGGLLERLRVAWLVFTGECDALRWHRQ